MTTDSNLTPSRKEILSDPLTAFFKSHKHTDKDAHKLEKSWQQLCQLQAQKTKIQIDSKKLSRRIGEAKRNNLNIDDLKSTMQRYSRQLKQLSDHIAVSENEILTFFQSEDTLPGNNITTIENTGPFDHPENNDLFDINEISIVQTDYPDEIWDRYVIEHDSACIHHLAAWSELLNQSYSHQSFYFSAIDKANKIVGILPLIRLKSRLFGDMLVSMPFFQHAGAVADHPLIELKLIHSANELASRLGINHIEYRDEIMREGMPVQTNKVNMVLSLPKTEELLWQSFSPKLRAQIKRPQRERTNVLFGHIELLDDFYRVYARNMRDLGSPLHSKKFIANILNRFPNSSWIAVIQLNDKTVAAGLLLGFKDTMEIPLASTIRDVNHLSINMLLYWSVLTFAIKHGFKHFDFGRSTKNAGTYRFKKQWGAQAKPLYWHYWLNKGAQLPGLNPSNPKFALVIFLWKRLPIAISRWIGPHIVRNIP